MVPTWAWIVFNAFILLLLGIDLFFHKKIRVIKTKEALIWSGFWITLALLFNLVIYLTMGDAAALAFLTSYLIEKSLSIDNLFVFALIFSAFNTPPSYQHKVLFWGIVGAIIMRALFIFLGIALVSHFFWIFYLFGLILLISGLHLLFAKKKKVDPEKNPLLILCRKFMPLSEKYHDAHFFIKNRGKVLATPLLLVLISIESADLIFAVDSIPAVLAITTNPFIAYSSNLFAILGLRSLFFVLSDLMRLFKTLHYGIALILIFIGLKMIFSTLIQIPNFISLIVVLIIIVLSIIAGRFPVFFRK